MEMITNEVKIKFTEKILGPLPKNPNIYRDWVQTKKDKDSPPDDESANVPASDKTDEQLKGWTGFLQDEIGLFLYDYVLKGFLKYSATIMAEELKVKQLKSKVIKNVFVSGRKIYFIKNGKKFKEPDGFLERGLQVMVATGPRNTLMRSDHLPAGTTITFRISFRKFSPITQKIINSLLEYGVFCGLCQWRTGGYGKFEVISNKRISGEDRTMAPAEKKPVKKTAKKKSRAA